MIVTFHSGLLLRVDLQQILWKVLVCNFSRTIKENRYATGIVILFTQKNMYIGELIDKFIYHLQYEKNASPKTIENYTLRLNRFIAHTGDMEVEQLKRMHVLDYRMSLHQQ